jgi:hypothetical protein
VKWLESYATIGSTDLPNDMWQSRPEGQIEKCAEAAALRKSFPEELGNQLTAEEMEGRRVEGDVAVAEVAEVAQRRLPPAPPATRQIAHVETVDPDTGEVLQDEPARSEPQQEAAPARREASKTAEPKAEKAKVTSGRQKAEQPDQTPESGAYDPAPILAKIQEHLDGCKDDDMLEAVRAKHIMPLYNQLQPIDSEKAKAAYLAARDRIADATEEEERATNEADAAEAGDPAGPDERDLPPAEADEFPGDRPSALPPADKKPEKMNAAELEAHIRGYIETMTDADALKKRWYMDDELREILDDKVRKALRDLWKARMDELRAAEGQG